MDKTQGNERYTENYAVTGQPDRPVADAVRDFGPVVDQKGGDTLDLSYAAGRTISLGNFEFVRILIGACVGYVPVPSVQDGAFDEVKAFVTEILAREEAMVRRAQREQAALPPLPGVNRVIWVEYGLTLNAGIKYESHKVDIGMSRPIGDGEDPAEAMAAMETYLAQRVAAERDRLRGKE
jgi:hypothetical protein